MNCTKGGLSGRSFPHTVYSKFDHDLLIMQIVLHTNTGISLYPWIYLRKVTYMSIFEVVLCTPTLPVAFLTCLINWKINTARILDDAEDKKSSTIVSQH